MTLPWLLLVISLPGKAGATRVRIWRALKSGGAGILRDGVYVIPANPSARALFDQQAEEVRAGGGDAYLLEVANEAFGGPNELLHLFDRRSEYEDWAAEAARLETSLPGLGEAEVRRKETGLRKRLAAIGAIDFFPADGRRRANARMAELAGEINRVFSPGEPRARGGAPALVKRTEYQGRVWATRRNLWVDRVASAWLVRRFIDPRASFVWLDNPGKCPPNAVGFDFDSATFTHVGDLVTFEVLLFSFALEEDPALVRLGELVHYLDVGGIPVADATGFVTMLSGAKHGSESDDDFLANATPLFEHLYQAYGRDAGASAASRPSRGTQK